MLGPGLALLLPPGLPGHSPSAQRGGTPGMHWPPSACHGPLHGRLTWPPSRPVLIRLEKKGERCAVRSQFVQPICLPEPGSPFPAGHKCQIAGWGHQDESEWGWGRGPACCPGRVVGSPGAPPSLRAPCHGRRERLLQLSAGGARALGCRPQVQQPRGVWGRHQPQHAVRRLLRLQVRRLPGEPGQPPRELRAKRDRTRRASQAPGQKGHLPVRGHPWWVLTASGGCPAAAGDPRGRSAAPAPRKGPGHQTQARTQLSPRAGLATCH